MKISLKWLQNKGACSSGVDYVKEQKLLGLDGVPFVKKLIKLDRVDYANWLVVRLMTHKQQIKYAIYAAEQVIKIFEDKYPDDKRPREAIEAAKAYLKQPTKENKDKAYAAANAAYTAYASAHAAAYAAASAAAHAAAYAAANAAHATHAAACAAAYAATKKEMKTKIIKYGLRLI